MKKFIKDFCIRGLMFAWGGPFITAIVWLCIHAAGKLETLTVRGGSRNHHNHDSCIYCSGYFGHSSDGKCSESVCGPDSGSSAVC